MRVLRGRAVWGESDRTMNAQGAVAMRVKVEQTKSMPSWSRAGSGRCLSDQVTLQVYQER